MIAPKPENQPPAADPLPGRVSQTNKIAIVVGLLLFTVASGMLVSPRIISQTTIVWPLFLACAALGVVMAAVGSEAKIAKPGSTITGAGAIALILFLILMKAVGDAAPRYRGSLLVRGADPKATLALFDAKAGQSPTKASIIYKTDSSDGVVRNAGNMVVFDFTLDATGAYHLNDEACPSLYIEFADGKKKIWRFAKSKMIPADYNNFFQLEFIVDKDKLYSDNGSASSELKSCDSSAEANFVQETNVKAPPPVGLAHDAAVPSPPSAAVAQPAIAAPAPSASVPTPEPVSTPAAPSTAPTAPAASPIVAETTSDLANTKVVGYVIALQLTPDFKDVKKSWFDIEGRPGARFPVPGDLLTASRDKVSLYPEPYRWDPGEQKHVVPKPFAKLALGEKIRIGGDPFLARDENNGARYVICPVIEVLGRTFAKDKPFYPPAALPDGIKGYAYLGYLDTEGDTYVSKTFDNYTNPSALYPSPGDILVATANVWMRSGPRRWDPSKSDYVNAPTVMPITRGQYVEVGGDTFLAKGGLSVWIPISKVYNGGLADIARR